MYILLVYKSKISRLGTVCILVSEIDYLYFRGKRKDIESKNAVNA